MVFLLAGLQVPVLSKIVQSVRGSKRRTLPRIIRILFSIALVVLTGYLTGLGHGCPCLHFLDQFSCDRLAPTDVACWRVSLRGPGYLTN